MNVADSIHVLRLGRLTAPRTILYAGAGDGTVTLPVLAFVIRTGDRVILVDNGMVPLAASDPGAAWRGLATVFTPHIAAEDMLEARLAELGLALGDVTDMVFTHLHFDHAGGTALVPGARRWVQRIEYRNAVTPEPHYKPGYLRHEFSGPGEWTLLDGDATIAPGVHALFTPGHTHGHQSILVRLSSEWVVLTGDVSDNHEIFDAGHIPGVCVDPGDALRSIARLRTLQSALDARLIFSHED